MERRKLIALLLLLLVVGGSWWLAERSKKPAGREPALAHTPDFYLEGFSATVMGRSGRPEQRLVAERMTHYPDDDSTELNEPTLTLFDAEKPPWQVNSERGWLSGDGELLLLQGEVRIDRNSAPGIRPMHLVTRDLRVQPRQNYLETDAPVSAVSNSSRLAADGMQAWFNQPVRLKLLANVRGYYEVKPYERP